MCVLIGLSGARVIPILQDAEARIERLRQRAGIGGSDSKKKSSGSSSSRRQEEREETRLRREDESARHINFFQDLEQGRSLSSVVATAATDKGVPLAPSKADLRRWYSSRRDGDHSKDEDDADGKRYVRLSPSHPSQPHPSAPDDVRPLAKTHTTR